MSETTFHIVFRILHSLDCSLREIILFLLNSQHRHRNRKGHPVSSVGSIRKYEICVKVFSHAHHNHSLSFLRNAIVGGVNEAIIGVVSSFVKCFNNSSENRSFVEGHKTFDVFGNTNFWLLVFCDTNHLLVQIRSVIKRILGRINRAKGLTRETTN